MREINQNFFKHYILLFNNPFIPVSMWLCLEFKTSDVKPLDLPMILRSTIDRVGSIRITAGVEREGSTKVREAMFIRASTIGKK